MKEYLKKRVKMLRPIVSLTLVMLLICGFIFPLTLTGLSSLLFPKQAEGSLIKVDGEVVGAEFVGQDFTEDYFLKCRPSAYQYNTYTVNDEGQSVYNDGTEFAGVSSGSNNYAPTNADLVSRVESDIEAFLVANPEVNKEEIPTDLMTASGSGLDPHISPASAKIQVAAVSKASGLSEEKIQEIINKNTVGKVLGIFGEEVTNVLLVNLEIAQEMGIISE